MAPVITAEPGRAAVRFSGAGTAAEEDCAQVGQPDYYTLARAECRCHIQLLRNRFGPELEGARFRVTTNPHDVGDYLDVIIEYDTNKPAAVEYAFRVEREAPSRWDE